MTSKVKITAVSFDTDGNKKLAKSLSQQYVGSTHDIEHEADEDPLDLIADIISNDSGWCIFSIAGELIP